MTWLSSNASTPSPENSAKRAVSPSGANPAPASARLIDVPVPPKSSSATTPVVGNPGAACSAVSAAAESGTSAAGTPPGARAGTVRNAPRNAPTAAGPQ